MAKNIEINIKGSDGNYEVLYPSVNPNILKLDSGNINIDDSVNEKLGLADGSTVSDVLNKLSAGVFYGETEVEVNFNWTLKDVTSAEYLNGTYVFRSGTFGNKKTLYYSTNLKENLNKCILMKNSAIVEQNEIYLSEIIKSQDALWILKSDSLSSGSNKYVELFKSIDGITFNYIQTIGYSYVGITYMFLSLLDDGSLFTWLIDYDSNNEDYTYEFMKSSTVDYSIAWNKEGSIDSSQSMYRYPVYSKGTEFIVFNNNKEAGSNNYVLYSSDLKTWKEINYSVSSPSNRLNSCVFKGTKDGWFAFGTYSISSSYSGKKYYITEAGNVSWTSFNWPVGTMGSVYFSPAYANGMWLGYVEYSYTVLRRRDSDNSFSAVNTINNGGQAQETGTNYVYYLNNEFLIFPISGNKLIRTKDGEDYSITWTEKQNRIKNALESIIDIDTIQITNKYEVITYTGNGTNSIDILFQRPPHLVLVQSTNAGSDSSCGMIFKDVPYITTWWIGSDYFIDGEEKVRFSIDGTQITIYRDSGSSNYEELLNASGKTYYAIGLY